MDSSIVGWSKLLSLVLRHHPKRLGLQLDPGGWVDVDALLTAMAQRGMAFNRDLLERVVAENDKQRFSFNADHTRIRANQGHSIPVDLGLVAQVPPEQLFHGTASRNLPSIRAGGLRKGKRQHVHLSIDEETAVKVGARHGDPAVLVVQAGRMAEAGHAFYRSENGVWLTDAVPPEYLVFPAG